MGRRGWETSWFLSFISGCWSIVWCVVREIAGSPRVTPVFALIHPFLNSSSSVEWRRLARASASFGLNDNHSLPDNAGLYAIISYAWLVSPDD
jgi:hypothetical protein